MNLPDVWGAGALFCFSGLDGKNLYSDDFCGTLSGDRIGIIFHTPVIQELHFCLNNVKDTHMHAVTSDWIHVDITGSNGHNHPLRIIFKEQHLIIGDCGENVIPNLHFYGDFTEESLDNIRIFTSKGHITALGIKHCSGRISFAFAHGHEKDAVLQLCSKGLQEDINEAETEKLNFLKNLPKVQGDELIESLFYKCCSVMKSQVYTAEGPFKGYWTTPDRLPHKKMWLWDSVFHSLGNYILSERLAEDSIMAPLDIASKDGFIPHMADIYGTSKITQPPVLAYGIWKLFEKNRNRQLLSKTYDRLKSYLIWNKENRDSNKNNLFEWAVSEDPNCHCDECGMDNSPRFDDKPVLDAIDFSCFMANETRYMAYIANELNMPEEAKFWSEWHEEIKDAVNSILWDENDGFYYDFDVNKGELKKVQSVASFLPLFAGVCDHRQAALLVAALKDESRFFTPLGVPSIAVSDSTYGTDMWRGPVWINYNYMIAEGLREYGYDSLADFIIDKTIRTVAFWYAHDGVIYEFYESQNRVSPQKLSRKGPAVNPYNIRIRMQTIRDYGWSCTLVADMIYRYYGTGE